MKPDMSEAMEMAGTMIISGKKEEILTETGIIQTRIRMYCEDLIADWIETGEVKDNRTALSKSIKGGDWVEKANIRRGRTVTVTVDVTESDSQSEAPGPSTGGDGRATGRRGRGRATGRRGRGGARRGRGGRGRATDPSGGGKGY